MAPVTYRDLVLLNLQHLRDLATLHPRLALVGAHSELENLVNEIVPGPIIVSAAERNPSYQERVSNPGDPDAIYRLDINMYGVRQIIFGQSASFPDLRKLQRQADSARHGRRSTTPSEVLDILDQLKTFVLALDKVPLVYDCICGEKIEYPVATALSAAPSTRLLIPCRRCKEPPSFEVGDPREAQNKDGTVYGAVE